MRKILKTLAKSVREYKKYALISPIFMIGEVILEVLIPFLMAELIDEGVANGNMNIVLKVGIMLVGCAILSLICGALGGVFASKASSGFATNLRKDMYYNIQKFSFSNIDKFKSSSLITRLTTDISYIQMAFQMLIRMAFRAPVMLIISLIFAISINARLSLIFLVVLPFLILTLGTLTVRAHKYFKRVFKTYDKLNNVVEENVRGVRVVKSYILEDEEKKKFGKVSQNIYNDFSKAEKIMAFTMPIMQFAIYTCIILIAWFGAQTIVSTNGSELSTGQLTTMITYSIQILTSLMMLGFMLVMLVISRESAERVSEVLNEESDIINPENPIKEIENGSIEFNNVSFSYVKDKNKECLKDIDIKIKSGETIGIIGGTGSGKSSLVNLIPRLYDVTDGELLVGGKDVRKYDLETLRDSVAVVLQKNVLFSGTIIDNIRWGNEKASEEEIVEACKLAQADSFIQSFPNKYKTKIEQGGTNVSGGQKQRLCIARALLKKPKILILDDSTSAVDTRTDKLIQDAFKEKIPDTTKIIIAQRISSVEGCDRIIVMDDGRIDAFDTHENLLKNNKIYREVYESQTNG